MWFRYLFFALIATGLFYLFKWLYDQMPKKGCDYCEGKGYWLGVRGERNHCKECGGTGKRS